LPSIDLDHRGFFAADVGARAAMDEDVEIVARTAGVLAEQARVIGFGHGGEQRFGFADIFAANVDVGRAGPIAKPATSAPSISLCGSWRMISRSLHEPGSDSSALITRKLGRPSRFPWA
jgi:hypothetical protein